jgi:hypothetical protein
LQECPGMEHEVFGRSFYCRPEFLVQFVHLARQNFSG